MYGNGAADAPGSITAAAFPAFFATVAPIANYHADEIRSALEEPMKDSAPGHREITVMTLNVYFGTDLRPLFVARDLPELIEAVATAWTQVKATDIPARARKIADEIVAAAPDLVGLQEIAKWSAGTPGAMSPRFDFLLLILEALRDPGAFYVPIAISKDLDQVAPLDMSGNLVRLEDRHAVLLRVAPMPLRVRPYNLQADTFSTLFEVVSPIMGSLKAPRSWIAIDALLGDQQFRFIETHLESFDHDVQLAQCKELIATLEDDASPIIMVGDFNSNANRQAHVPDFTPAYPEMITAGFMDCWSTVNQGDLGNTCCHAPDLRNPVTSLNRRLDLVLTRGNITPVSAKLAAGDPSARTHTGLWPSDHAGLVAKLRFQ
jgi:endonuclease/exonuclease/phosphatase family metal-dependent hydrolase